MTAPDVNERREEERDILERERMIDLSEVKEDTKDATDEVQHQD